MRKIMFSDKYGLTKAVLEGRKTMTRRIIKNQDADDVFTGSLLCIDRARYKIGEVVAVAQPYKDVIYIGGYKHPIVSEPGWSNKMFVRAEFMIHQIRITNVWVERLRDISDEDCLKEGIEKDGEVYSFNDYEGYKTPRNAFAELINRVSGKGTWESNPYVFVYEFELVK